MSKSFVEVIRNRSKRDDDIIVGSEIRQLCEIATTALLRLEAIDRIATSWRLESERPHNLMDTRESPDGSLRNVENMVIAKCARAITEVLSGGGKD